MMQDAIHQLAGAETEHQGPPLSLETSQDPMEYVEGLLQGCRAGFLGSPTALNGEYTLQQHSSQTEVSLYATPSWCQSCIKIP